jgi:NAD(P)-dependent dehydrogenase (short-subunit alcohol dehydrogenase family)
MTFNLSGKHALLAGTADDLLTSVGTALADAGAQLAPVLDTSRLDTLEEQVRQFGVIDIFIFNAGWRHTASFLDHSFADWDAALLENFESPVFLAQAIVRAMIVRGAGGRIIFLSGVEGLMSFEGTAAAGTSMTMLTALARMMAVDLAPHRITVNVLAVGWVEGKYYADMPEAMRQHIVNGIPQGHPATPNDIGAAVTFLASDLAAYITGTVLPVDGGYTLTRAPGQTMFNP